MLLEENYDDKFSSIVIDVENQNLPLSNKENIIQIPLKGILKKKIEISDEERNFQIIAIKIFKIIGTLILFCPIIFCDLYYGFTDISCVNMRIKELNITLKLYLILCGFMNLLLLFITIISIIYFEDNNSNKIMYILSTFKSYLSCLFNLLWNILGSVIFWGYVYENGECNISVSTYIFISIIIKLVSCVLFLFYKTR